MSDVYEHNPDDHDDPRPALTWFFGFVGAVLLVVTVLIVTALYYNVKAQEVAIQVVRPQRLEVIELREQQEAMLHAPAGWVEREDQGETVRAYTIPIEQAMELVVKEYNAGS